MFVTAVVTSAPRLLTIGKWSNTTYTGTDTRGKVLAFQAVRGKGEDQGFI